MPEKKGDGRQCKKKKEKIRIERLARKYTERERGRYQEYRLRSEEKQKPKKSN